ncbi:hypothetical protein BN946_scf184806.g22 [Trametes cinnabarina]|uniref:Uncharacterized protein n=1 Tax=Pycnoporus cinnabarinus TaxID=5643 RepID=A0A060S6U9_PYCCI|nr:hypothetical protein BN946_scf184806.g22 [Trametes cinnabarina]
MVNFTILAGGYSTFIATYLFNSDANTLSLLGQFPTGQNPSWIDLHPTNKSILYATNENSDGALQSFFFKQDGSLTAAIGQTSSGGNGPAFAVPLSTGEVAVMNFGSGNGLVVPTQEDPLEFTEGAPLISFPAAVSHPHMALEVGQEVFVPDLIRGMELSGGSENEFLVAAGVAGEAGVVVLRRTQGGADLEIVATNKDVPTRSSFVWLDSD